jgi:hypothetical protein
MQRPSTEDVRIVNGQINHEVEAFVPIRRVAVLLIDALRHKAPLVFLVDLVIEALIKWQGEVASRCRESASTTAGVMP